MGFNLFFWKTKIEVDEVEKEGRLCFCGSNRDYSDCHELEFALPLGERPEPD